MSLWDPVYKLVKQIPRGRVLSYGAVAKILRLKGGARSAGRAMSATPRGKGIPWHRVLSASGKIVIREPYASLQKKLLECEGVNRHRISRQHESSTSGICKTRRQIETARESKAQPANVLSNKRVGARGVPV